MNKWLKKIDEFFEDLFLKKLPQLSGKIRGNIVKFLPWLILVSVALSFPGILAGMGIGLIASPFVFLSQKGGLHIIRFLISIAQFVFSALAISYLFKVKKKGWQLLYWSMLLSLVGAVLYFSGLGVLITGLELYFLYQIKSSYK